MQKFKTLLIKSNQNKTKALGNNINKTIIILF